MQLLDKFGESTTEADEEAEVETAEVAVGLATETTEFGSMPKSIPEEDWTMVRWGRLRLPYYQWQQQTV
jgi:hypothetical protein